MASLAHEIDALRGRLHWLVRGRLNSENTRSAFEPQQRSSTIENYHAPLPRHPTFKETRSGATRPTRNADSQRGNLTTRRSPDATVLFVKLNVRDEREQNPSRLRPPQAAERPASPAAHSTHQARRLADESRAIRGRVHAVVMLQRTHPPSRAPELP